MHKRKYLKKEAVTRLLIASSIPFLLAGVLTYSYMSDKIGESIKTKNELLSDAVTGEVRGSLREPYIIINEIIILITSHNHPAHEIATVLDNTVQNSAFFESIFLINEEDIIINAGLSEDLLASKNDFLGLDLSGQSYIKKSREKGETVWSDIFLSPLTGDVSLSVSVPFKNHIIVGSFSIEHLHALTLRFRHGNNINTSIVDNRGVLIFHPERSLVEQHLNMNNSTPISNAMAGRTGTYEYEFQGASYIGSTSNIPETGWTVLVSQNRENAFAPVSRARAIFLAGLAVMIIVISYITILASDRLIRPLHILREKARAIAGGKYDSALDEQEYIEIEDLAVSLRHMASAIQSREDELRKSEEKYRQLVETMSDGMAVLGKDGILSYTNPRFCKMIGYTRDEMHGQPVKKYFDSQNLSIMESQLKKRRRGESEPYELGWTKKDGSKMVTLMSPKILYDDKGRFNGSFAVITDITEKKNAEKALRQSEEKFSKAFRSSPAFITITTLQDGLFIDVNDSFLEASGYSRKEIIGHTSRDLGTWITPDEREKVIEHVRMHGEIANYETAFRIKSGELLSVLYSAELITIDGEQCIIAVTLDITERKRLEAQLMHSQKMEAVGQLAGGIAHDFNNILTAIISYSHLVKNKMKEEGKPKENVDKILALSERAANITSGLLTFSRKQHYEFVPLKLNDIITNVDSLLTKLISEDISVQTRLCDKDPVIIADKTQIEQILINLATNASDAMNSGGTLTIETNVIEIGEQFIRSHGFGEPGIYAMLSVTDTGAGMDEETRERIFEPFFTTKEVGKGTGLGLSIVYGIVKQHNGYINVYSEENGGSTIRIYLPEIHSEIEDEHEAELHDLTGNGETLLIAEDEPEVRNSIKNILEEFNYIVIEAVDGKDALEKFRENRETIQLLILDVVMPGMSGKETHKEIMKLAPEIKAIFTSGYTADIIRKKKVLEENVEFVAKPILPDKFLMKVKETLSRQS